MTVDINMGSFLQNVRVTLENHQYSYATFLLDYGIKCARQCSCPLSLFPLDVAMGLHRGQVRTENEDSVFALQGLFPVRSRCTQAVFPVFLKKKAVS